jgi:hypothetical protein
MQQQIIKCPSCGADCTGPIFCNTCGTRLPLPISQIVTEQPVTSPVTSPQQAAGPKQARPTVKYTALRAVATVYRIIGWVVVVGGSLFSIALGVMALTATGTLADLFPLGAGPGTVGIAIAGLIISILSGLFLVAFADVCSVLIDIEKNTGQK